MENSIMYNISYGLYILTAKNNNKDNGCVINTLIQVTSTPNQVAITVNKANFTHDMIKESGEFNVSILSQAATFEVFEHFGFQSGKTVNKFENYPYANKSKNGLIYLTNYSNSYICCKVSSAIDLGTHTMFIADVIDGEKLNNDPSLTYAYYQDKIKPKKQATNKKGYVCTICNYVYEGDTLPSDFVCPICKHPASDFRKL